MTDITAILGGSFSPRIEIQKTPEEQLIQAIQDAGLSPPQHIQFDGKIHRFASGTGKKHRGDDAGWYVAYGDGVPAGAFGDHRQAMTVPWVANIGRELTLSERLMASQQQEEAKRAREQHTEKVREAASQTVSELWENATDATAEHPYLARKGIKPHGSRVLGDGRLILPIYINGELSCLQYIKDGEKRYHTGGAVTGGMWSLGEVGDVIYVAEGFATAATIHEVTGEACYIAYSAHNLPKVAQQLRDIYSAKAITIVADNDAGGIGRAAADQAAARSGCRVIMPPIEDMDANDYHLAGHDLGALLAPDSNDWLVKASDYRKQPAPLSWLIKGWVQRDALHMVHGPSGSGKTFAVLDMALSIASHQATWRDKTVHGGPVVYLAGEGHHGLRSRLAAWATHHGVEEDDLWVSKSGCDLNTPQGLQRAMEAIAALPELPVLIIIDTLHRFMHGDENSAVDAKTMLDACAALMEHFGSAVLLVHHTGNAEEAQHRARGSSAWRGALDIEVSVVPAGKVDPIEIIQRKSKDAELAAPLFAKLESVTIPGWVDEDGDPVSSAVMVEEAAPVKVDGKLHEAKVFIRSAWEESGRDTLGGRPHVSFAYIRGIFEAQGKTSSTAKNYARAQQGRGPLAPLVSAEIVREEGSGWTIIDPGLAAAMAVESGAGNK